MQADQAKNLLVAQARAIDLFGDLGRRAEKLLGVAPKLRATGADTVVQKLLSGDAMIASDPVAGISDRGLRRLFGRLVELGAVRELSGRPTFRIYGLWNHGGSDTTHAGKKSPDPPALVAEGK